MVKWNHAKRWKSLQIFVQDYLEISKLLSLISLSKKSKTSSQIVPCCDLKRFLLTDLNLTLVKVSILSAKESFEIVKSTKK